MSAIFHQTQTKPLITLQQYLNISHAPYMPKQKTQLLVLDVDGVLTSGDLHFNENGEYLKTFNTLDGHGLNMLNKAGITIAIITGRKSSMLRKRLEELNVLNIYDGIENKLEVLEYLYTTLGLNTQQVAYMGDDLPDLDCLKSVGFAICPNNAHSYIKQQTHWQTTKNGGCGAVREVCDHILWQHECWNQLF